MWNMGSDPPYIPAKFGDDAFKLEKVLDKKNQKVNDNHKKKNNKNNNNKNNNKKTKGETLRLQ